MALYPCSFNGHRYAGRQSSVYLALVNGTTAYRAKRRLCGKHFDDAVDWLNGSYEEVDTDAEPDEEASYPVRLCNNCDGDDPPWSFFATAYPSSGPPRAFYAAVCEDCLAGFRQNAHLGTK